MNIVKDMKKEVSLDKLFAAGAHFGQAKSRRHPSVKPYIFGVRKNADIFDLEKTAPTLEKAKEFMKTLGRDGKQILLIGGKAESREAIRGAAKATAMPFVAGRFIGGTITNFANIRGRVNKLAELTLAKEKGELAKYTKKERLLLDRLMTNLETAFGGLATLRELPKAIFVVDSRREEIAVAEAKKMKIPVIALVGSDCDVRDVEYPIVGNDSSVQSIAFFVNEMVLAYTEGKAQAPRPPVQPQMSAMKPVAPLVK